MDMRKDIDSLSDIVREDMCLDPTRLNGVFIFISKSRRLMKILYRGLHRFELTKIRLEKDKFLLPVYDEERNCYRLLWSDFITITESVSTTKLKIRGLDKFKGFFITDGYVVYKLYEKITDAAQISCACLTHIRRLFVDALHENRSLMSWFINKIKKLFEVYAECKEHGIVGEARAKIRVCRSNFIMQEIENKFNFYINSGSCITLRNKW